MRAEEAVAGLAAQQGGCVSRRQAVAAGMGDSMIRNRVQRGSWVKRHQGVYAMGGSPAGWEQDLWAAYLCAGDEAVVSHETALLLHGLSSEVARRYPLELIVPA